MRNPNTAPFLAELKYWRDYNGTGDDYRRNNDRDCVLSGGNLRADTIFSLWLPMRYTLNRLDRPMWRHWRDVEYAELRPRGIGLKDHAGFLNDMIQQIDDFLPDSELTRKLSTLFELGQQRCNEWAKSIALQTAIDFEIVKAILTRKWLEAPPEEYTTDSEHYHLEEFLALTGEFSDFTKSDDFIRETG